jgi:acetyl esterase
MQDVAQIIANDHRKVEHLFDQLERGQGDQGDRKRLVDQVIGELTAHAEAEEQIVYPAVRDMVPGGGAMADQAITEHKTMKQELAKLDQGQPGDLEFENTLTALIDSVRDHVPKEENELLPALRNVIGQDKMEELGKIFEEVKGTIPTR